jgi:hypothetical protein
MKLIEINKHIPTQMYMPLNLMHCFQAKKKVTKVASERCNGKQKLSAESLSLLSYRKTPYSLTNLQKIKLNNKFFPKKGKYDGVRTKYG